jgi:hypothetical protein
MAGNGEDAEREGRLRKTRKLTAVRHSFLKRCLLGLRVRDSFSKIVEETSKTRLRP